jgi:hypothetical protein
MVAVLAVTTLGELYPGSRKQLSRAGVANQDGGCRSALPAYINRRQRVDGHDMVAGLPELRREDRSQLSQATDHYVAARKLQPEEVPLCGETW